MNAVTDVVAGHMNAVVIAVAGCVIAVVTAFTLRSPGLRDRCCCGSSHRARGWTDAAIFIPPRRAARGGASAHLDTSLTTILSAEETGSWLPLAIALPFAALKARRFDFPRA
jgi:hypothetical protein